VLVFDVKNQASFDSLGKVGGWRDEFARMTGASPQNFPFVLVGNKAEVDLTADRRVYEEDVRDWLYGDGGIMPCAWLAAVEPAPPPPPYPEGRGRRMHSPPRSRRGRPLADVETSFVGNVHDSYHAAQHVFRTLVRADLSAKDNFGRYRPPDTMRVMDEPEEEEDVAQAAAKGMRRFANAVVDTAATLKGDVIELYKRAAAPAPAAGPKEPESPEKAEERRAKEAMSGGLARVRSLFVR
jgi:hypothetical protein